MSNSVKIVFFLGSLAGAIVFTYLDMLFINFLIGMFMFISPSTPSQWIITVLAIVFAIALVLFTIALYALVIMLGSKEVGEQSSLKSKQQEVLPSGPSRSHTVHTHPVMPRQRQYRRSGRWSDEANW